MRNLRLLLGASAIVAATWLVAAPAALAFELTTCTLVLNSTGAEPDTASGPGTGGTTADPFIVDWDGTVAWSGTTGGVVVKDGVAHVEVFGLPTPLRGETGPNEDENKNGSGTVGVKENAPFKFTGLYFVSGALEQGGAAVCKGSGWVKLAGDPVGTLPFFAGLGTLIVGAILMLASIRGRHPIRGTLGGLLAGVGTAVLAIIFSTLPLQENTPLIIVVALTILGLVVGLVGSSGASSDTGSSSDAGGTGSGMPPPPEPPAPEPPAPETLGPVA